MQKIRTIALGIFALFVLVHAARGATYQTIANGDWNTGATWNGSGAYPTSSSDVERVAGFTVTVDGAGESAAGGALTLGYNIGTLNYSGTLSIGGSAALTISGSSLDVGYNGGVQGTINQTGGTLNVTDEKIYIGTSSTNDVTAGSTGVYNFSGGVINQTGTGTIDTSTTTVGYASGTYSGSNGTLAIIGNAASSSISLGYLEVGCYGTTAGSGSAGTLSFAIGSSGVTPINAARTYLPTTSTGGTANLAISLLAAPPAYGNGNPEPVMLIDNSNASNYASGAAIFSGLPEDSIVSATLAGVGIYSWELTYTGDSNFDNTGGIDTELIDGTFTAATPEPMVAAPLCLALLAFVGRPARRAVLPATNV